jgi:molybdenum cofactor guanylyltransferase
VDDQLSSAEVLSTQISTPVSLAVIILAGGRSTRMGQDKAMIEIDGVPLIRRIYNVVASCQVPEMMVGDDLRSSPQIYVLTPWKDRYRSILPIGCNFMLEQQPDRGPISAFAHGLTAITASWILLIACDLPNLSTPIIQAGIDQLPSISAQSIAYLPKQIEKGWEPLCGFYRHICHHSAIEYINAGGKSFQDWLKTQIVTEFVIADPTCLANCNTPAELATIIKDRSLESTPDQGDPNNQP